MTKNMFHFNGGRIDEGEECASVCVCVCVCLILCVELFMIVLGKYPKQYLMHKGERGTDKGRGGGERESDRQREREQKRETERQRLCVLKK